MLSYWGGAGFEFRLPSLTPQRGLTSVCRHGIVLRQFPQSLSANVGIVSRLGHDRYPFHFPPLDAILSLDAAS
jgi:hypothetical protein